ncbi:MAG: hypothetical protein ACREAC_20910, partial [Blastocatellia bacterium]
MPWTIQTVTIVGLLALPFEWYAARRITIALTILTGKPRKAIRIAAIAVFFYPILYPISAMTSFA